MKSFKYLSTRSMHILSYSIAPRINKECETEDDFKEELKKLILSKEIVLSQLMGCGPMSESEILDWIGLEDNEKLYEVHSKSKLINILDKRDLEIEALKNELRVCKPFFQVVDNHMKSTRNDGIVSLKPLTLERMWCEQQTTKLC